MININSRIIDYWIRLLCHNSKREDCGMFSGYEKQGITFITTYFSCINRSRFIHNFRIDKKQVAQIKEKIKAKNDTFLGFFHTHFEHDNLSAIDKKNIINHNLVWIIGNKSNKNVFAYYAKNKLIIKEKLC